MKKRFKILLFLFILSAISGFIGYTYGKEQIVESANKVGEMYVETAEKYNVPKPIVPVLPFGIGFTLFSVVSIYGMHLSIKNRKPNKFFVVGSCGKKAEVYVMQEIWKNQVSYRLKILCPLTFNAISISENSRNEIIDGVKRFCSEECNT